MSTQSNLFAELLSCTKNWNEHDLVPKAQKIECRRIGMELNKLGGIELMRQAYYEAKAENFNVHAIQAYWNGIGDWVW